MAWMQTHPRTTNTRANTITPANTTTLPRPAHTATNAITTKPLPAVSRAHGRL
jgi:hypothetical protein